MPLDTGQSSQYNGSMTVPPYPYQGNQPYVQGTVPDAMMPYDPQGMYSQVPQQMQQQGMYPQMQQQGMYPQMQQQDMYPQMQQQDMYPQMQQQGMYPQMQQQYMSVEQLYNQARQAYSTRDYQGAMMGFQELAMRYPQSDLADNAYYWMGEIYYNSKNYPAAIQSFQTVVQMYPQGNKVPDAMVKMGFAYAEIRQYNIARSILNDVSMRFSDNARIRNLAVKKLNSLNNLY
jgi:tol-pal system protein YbgF